MIIINLDDATTTAINTTTTTTTTYLLLLSENTLEQPKWIIENKNRMKWTFMIYLIATNILAEYMAMNSGVATLSFGWAIMNSGVATLSLG
jgi:hypothetical protein